MTGNSKIPVVVIIATSGRRTPLLLDRALRSVYRQSAMPLEIILIDDNMLEEGAEESDQFYKIAQGIEEVRAEILQHKYDSLGIEGDFEDFYKTSLVVNERTHGFSGTGAWNTGAFHALEYKKQQPFIAILDDDDEWLPDYLHTQWEAKKAAGNQKVAAVISGFERVEPKRTVPICMQEKECTKEAFFIKNPGLQGSNLFIDLEVFWSIGGFDESMRSTTDRDLSIRLMEFLAVEKAYGLVFTGEILLRHFTISDQRVTSNVSFKKGGLDVFYRKYYHQFSPKEQKKSLSRAKDLFKYEITKIAKVNQVELGKVARENRPKFNLVIGTISSSPENLDALLASFLFLHNRDGKQLLAYQFLILVNGEYTTAIQKVVRKYKTELALHVIHEDVIKRSISKNRNLIQQAVYKVGTAAFTDNFVSWIIDDDHLFCCDTESGTIVPDYFGIIAAHKGKGIDALFGGISAAPPLPFLSTIRTQLLDFYYGLTVYLSEGKLNHWQKQAVDFEDFYYDMSRNFFQHLEFPYFHLPRKETGIEGFLEEALKMKSGQPVFRKIKYKESELGRLGEASIYRGGNTIIYTPKLLNTPNYTPSKGYNRRSDFNWAIINKYLGFNLLQVTLPLKHDRSLEKHKYNFCTEKFEADLKGMIFYRIFEQLLIDKKVDLNYLEEQFEKLTEETFQLLYITQLRSKTLTKLILSAIEKAKQNQRKEVQLLLEESQNFLLDTIQLIEKIESFHKEKQADFRLNINDLLKIKEELNQIA